MPSLAKQAALLKPHALRCLFDPCSRVLCGWLQYSGRDHCLLLMPATWSLADIQLPPAGVDPKSIVCEHFRAGQCTKGHKCKYSHDLNLERNTAKAAVVDEEDGKEGRGGCALWIWYSVQASSS